MLSAFVLSPCPMRSARLSMLSRRYSLLSVRRFTVSITSLSLPPSHEPRPPNVRESRMFPTPLTTDCMGLVIMPPLSTSSSTPLTEPSTVSMRLDTIPPMPSCASMSSSPSTADMISPASPLSPSAAVRVLAASLSLPRSDWKPFAKALPAWAVSLLSPKRPSSFIKPWPMPCRFPEVRPRKPSPRLSNIAFASVADELRAAVVSCTCPPKIRTSSEAASNASCALSTFSCAERMPSSPRFSLRAVSSSFSAFTRFSSAARAASTALEYLPIASWYADRSSDTRLNMSLSHAVPERSSFSIRE